MSKRKAEGIREDNCVAGSSPHAIVDHLFKDLVGAVSTRFVAALTENRV
ncbi:MAG: hypothetical protein PUP91_19495 [Rhizonema sp. PD37]|nr:hypothetical protein [Rhizonema sp. PD37]